MKNRPTQTDTVVRRFPLLFCDQHFTCGAVAHFIIWRNFREVDWRPAPFDPNFPVYAETFHQWRADVLGKIMNYLYPSMQVTNSTLSYENGSLRSWYVTVANGMCFQIRGYRPWPWPKPRVYLITATKDGEDALDLIRDRHDKWLRKVAELYAFRNQ